ncbi:hypothetical protein WDM22_02175 [Bradyrhizobium septentrionale]|uniref:Uncharacterized protein n=1 Tax=Bradyrhizobium septentrionale TaxID=1404411 RepID=A0ABZ2NXV8_9BRAD|nr:hypothetical protein [Bradyrhizobium septentrionale]UGY19064.1 hypothetical protein HAP48_0017390 [Bradyrhizobium septentrionale]UGY27796.1 hypothetical protein HU675_0014125 [Bradyrhizobium septentrionale]
MDQRWPRSCRRSGRLASPCECGEETETREGKGANRRDGGDQAVRHVNAKPGLDAILDRGKEVEDGERRDREEHREPGGQAAVVKAPRRHRQHRQRHRNGDVDRGVELMGREQNQQAKAEEPPELGAWRPAAEVGEFPEAGGDRRGGLHDHLRADGGSLAAKIYVSLLSTGAIAASRCDVASRDGVDLRQHRH